ncbi:MAG: hypothetical protein EXR27_03335 [Betaproteobacteria bacterium]|nr:hypothetical protein [Betaproteobacteria bacterium]
MRVAISNERILGMDGDTVCLRVRDSTHRNRRRTLVVPAHTFIERFLLHVLPQRFKRIRHNGQFGPAGKAVKLVHARPALAAPMPDPLVVESVQAFLHRIDRHQMLRCTYCGNGQFVPTLSIAPVRVPPVWGPQ